MKSRVAGSFILASTGKSSDRIKSYGRGRVCDVRGCTTILSSYNPETLCSAHLRAGGHLFRRP